MIGTFIFAVKMALICKMTLKVSLILFALNSLKLSAQSPPCIKKALPSTAEASFCLRLLHSPAKTNGGNFSIFFNAFFKASLSLYSGICFTVKFSQEFLVHLLIIHSLQLF